jgi:poly(A) polymerase
VSAALDAARGALADADAWLVGGAVRDRLLGRDTEDIDLVAPGEPRAYARALARASGGVAFPLSEAFGAWRVVGPEGAWHADISPLAGEDIEADLARRDFTVNAIAEPLGGGDTVDPFGGAEDLRAGRLRMVSAQAFADDPLRALRLVRLAAELGLEPEPGTLAAARARAADVADVAPERVFAELKRILLSPAPVAGLRRMDELGLTAAVLPELEPMHGVEQSDYHHLDVHEHTLAVLDEVVALEGDPSAALGGQGPAVAALLSEPLADDLSRGAALRVGALLHDVGKPATRQRTSEGRVTFLGHDEEGARIARAALARLRASERLRAHVAALARNHLRLGFLVHERPLDRRDVYRYLRACEPVEVDVTLLSVADRLATRGRGAEPAIAAHMELARMLLAEGLRWREQGPPGPLIKGDQLAAELGIEHGPELGRLLRELEEAAFAGEVSSPEEAVRLARELRSRPAAG